MSYYITDIYRECPSGDVVIKHQGTFDTTTVEYEELFSGIKYPLIRRTGDKYYPVRKIEEGKLYKLFINGGTTAIFTGTLSCNCSKVIPIRWVPSCEETIDPNCPTINISTLTLNNRHKLELISIINNSTSTRFMFVPNFSNFTNYDQNFDIYGEFTKDSFLEFLEFMVYGVLKSTCDILSPTGYYQRLSLPVFDDRGCKIFELYSLTESSLKVDISYDCNKGLQYTNNPKSSHSLPPVGTKLKNGNYKWLIQKKEGTGEYQCEERCYEAELTVNCLASDKPKIDPNNGCECCLILDQDVIITPFPEQCTVKVENKSQKTIRVDLLVYPSINHTCSGKGVLRKQISLIPNTSIVWQYDVTFDSKIFIGYDECFLQKCLPPCSNNLSPIKNYVTSVEARKVKILGVDHIVIDNNDKYNGDVLVELPFIKPNFKFSIPKGSSLAIKSCVIPTHTQIITTSTTWENVKVEKTVSVPVSFDTVSVNNIVIF